MSTPTPRPSTARSTTLPGRRWRGARGSPSASRTRNATAGRQPVPRNAPGVVHLFGELHGINGIRPPRQVELMPGYATDHTELQYIGTTSFSGEPRTIFGAIAQKTVSLTVRLNYSLNPELSVQFYGQPSGL